MTPAVSRRAGLVLVPAALAVLLTSALLLRRSAWQHRARSSRRCTSRSSGAPGEVSRVGPAFGFPETGRLVRGHLRLEGPEQPEGTSYALAVLDARTGTLMHTWSSEPAFPPGAAWSHGWSAQVGEKAPWLLPEWPRDYTPPVRTEALLLPAGETLQVDFVVSAADPRRDRDLTAGVEPHTPETARDVVVGLLCIEPDGGIAWVRRMPVAGG